MKTKLSLFIIFSSLVIGHLHAQLKDLRADINQPAFDKIVNATKFPLTLFEHKDPFKSLDSDPVLVADETTKIFNEAQSLAFIKESFLTVRAPESFDLKEANSVYRDAIQAEWYRILEDIDRIVEEGERNNRATNPQRIEFKDFTLDELKEIQRGTAEAAFTKFNAREKGAMFIKVHLPYARVDVVSRPTLKVQSPEFKLQNLMVNPTATGELWMKVPVFSCCRTVLGICVCVRVTWKWKRIASLTVSPRLGADVTVKFSESQLKIYAQAQFDKLFLDYFILRDIDLSGLANRYLRNRNFELYDVSKFVASLPYINANFRIESLALPPRTDGVSVELVIK